ncbi:HNH endonuclease [Kribbella sp. NPDC049174]|uniref:HNH endonuclease n=1 Tax=Kribbella sp. NPDC049174 TaxID=3364112 RepID=UPI003722DFE3
MKQCSIDGCERPHYGRGWCNTEHVAKLSGENHYRWKGGSARKLSAREWRATREVVLERDGYACVACGKDNRRSLIVHHLIKFDQGGPDETWNLVTACRACHARHHSLMQSCGVGLSPLSPNLEQWIRFDLHRP